MTDLYRIKKYIIDQTRTEYNKQVFIKNLEDFLQRLIDKDERKLVKDELQLKAGRQLLCSIAIDIASKSVPVSHYFQIFKKINFGNYNKQARLLFTDVVNEFQLVYRETEKKHFNDFKVILCPINDIFYYVDNKTFGVFLGEEFEFIHNLMIETVKDGIHLEMTRLDKGHHYRHFWITTQEELERMLSLKNSTNYIVDQLGLSQFDFNEERYQYFFYINLGDLIFDTFKPNATIVNWSDPRVGYISFSETISGKTFTISGYKDYTEIGLAERAFHILEIESGKLYRTSITPLKDAVTPPITINCNDIIEEAIKRFNRIQNA